MHTMIWLSMGLAIIVILLDSLSIRWLAQRVKKAVIVGEG